MSSTLPKYVQAAGQESGSAARGSTSAASVGAPSGRNTRQLCQEFLNTYRTLPDDFLTIPASYYPAPQDQLGMLARPEEALPAGPLVDMVDISIVEAQLNKNYGILRMDLYCKIRVGFYWSVTPVCVNGACNPKWDDSGIHRFELRSGIEDFHLLMYCEHSFTPDEQIATLDEPIPPEIFEGVTVERWFPLSGRLGPKKEGRILLVMSHTRVPAGGPGIRRFNRQDPLSSPVHGHALQDPRVLGGPMVLPVDPNINAYVSSEPAPNTGMVLPPAPIVGVDHHQRQQQQQQQIRHHHQPHEIQQAISQLSEMFPSIDRSIIRTVLEDHNLDKESAITTLLAMG